MKNHTLLTVSRLWLLLVIPMVTAGFYAITLPVSFDEACTFLLFTQNGIWESISTYPAPNNHVLHSVITTITAEIPSLPILLKLRISPIAVNLLSLIVWYRFVSRHFNKKLAFVVVAIASMLFLNVYYSYMSRGYGLLNLFFGCSLFAAFNIVKGENTTKNWLLFCLSSTFGFYVMPSFLYPFLTLNAFILFHKKELLKKQIFFGCLTIFLVVIAYSPILYHEGIGAIVGNRFVKPIGFGGTLKALPLFYLDTISDITGIHWLVWIVLGLLSLVFILKSKDKILKSFAVIFIVAPVVLLAIHCVIPFTRTFVYYNLVLALLVCLPLNERIQTLHYTFLIPVLLTIQVLLAFNFERKIYAYENKDLAANITAHKIIGQIKGDKKYYINKALISENLEFELISNHYKNYSIQRTNYDHISADTINGYDFIIISKESDQTINRKKRYQNQYYSIYK